LVFHTAPTIGKRRSLWQRIRNPQSGLGPGIKSRFFANSPSLFRLLPEAKRLEFVRTALGPSAGWTSRQQVVGRVPLHLGMTPEAAEVVNGKVRLQLRATDGSKEELLTEHIITGTGYRVDMDRLQFLSPEIRRQITMVGSSPALSSTFESSVTGLYFAGLVAANTFGPVMRFAFGAGFAARRIAKAMAKLCVRNAASAEMANSVVAREEKTSTL
jgi:hypothetical protein